MTEQTHMITMPPEIEEAVDKIRQERADREAQDRADLASRAIAAAERFNATRLPGMEPMDPHAKQPEEVFLGASTPLYRPDAQLRR